METENKIENNNPHKNKVHRILAHSYSIQFIWFLIGVCLDLVFYTREGPAFGGKFFASSITMSVGIIFLILASFLIFWAQKTSQNINKENINKETFCHGPYCYTRSPTHLGLFLLMLGFGMMVGAPFVILTSFLSLLISKFVFLNKQEKILAEKYGAPYLEYKKSVKF